MTVASARTLREEGEAAQLLLSAGAARQWRRRTQGRQPLRCPKICRCERADVEKKRRRWRRKRRGGGEEEM